VEQPRIKNWLSALVILVFAILATGVGINHIKETQKMLVIRNQINRELEAHLEHKKQREMVIRDVTELESAIRVKEWAKLVGMRRPHQSEKIEIPKGSIE
jgi:cell division protein FtsL